MIYIVTSGFAVSYIILIILLVTMYEERRHRREEEALRQKLEREATDKMPDLRRQGPSPIGVWGYDRGSKR